jgi:hypothetical protein
MRWIDVKLYDENVGKFKRCKFGQSLGAVEGCDVGGSEVWHLSFLSTPIFSSLTPLSVFLHSLAALGLGYTPLGIGLTTSGSQLYLCRASRGVGSNRFFDSLCHLPPTVWA